MDKQEFREQLQRLHIQLQHVGEVDEPDQVLLQQLNSDIQALLEHQEDYEKHHYNSLSSRLKDSIEKLEASHPNLTLLMGQIADALAKIGI
jgi:uncharacterized protein DUF4404